MERLRRQPIFNAYASLSEVLDNISNNPANLRTAMTSRENSYELHRSQVDTPVEIVSLFWNIVHRYRRHFSSVLDLGAGDGRFALGGGRFREYVGVELDTDRKPTTGLPKSAKISYECVFQHENEGYDACVGNPPYARHHDIEPCWRDEIAKRICKSTGYSVNQTCNLYVYFLFLALFKSCPKGLVAMIVPYEWVARPAALPLRNYINKHGWQVDAYRFSEPIFSSVDTTASISIIDKQKSSGRWNFFGIDRGGVVTALPGITGSSDPLLDYSGRGEIWSMRGMSPGSQKVFTLSETERTDAGLSPEDVSPCVTSLREIPEDLSNLTPKAFQTQFVDKGLKCWLVRSDRKYLSDRLESYLEGIPVVLRSTSTCLSRTPWYRYRLFDSPDLFVSSGFVGSAPKSLANSVGAYAVGAVHGVYNVPFEMREALQDFLSRSKVSTRVVAHSGKLRKLEIRQLNTILNEFSVGQMLRQ